MCFVWTVFMLYVCTHRKVKQVRTPITEEQLSVSLMPVMDSCRHPVKTELASIKEVLEQISKIALACKANPVFSYGSFPVSQFFP